MDFYTYIMVGIFLYVSFPLWRKLYKSFNKPKTRVNDLIFLKNKETKKMVYGEENTRRGKGWIAPSFLIVMFIVAIALIIGFDYVPAGSVGVKDTLGNVDMTPLQSGVYWTGFTTHTIDFSTRVQLREYESASASKDMQVVSTKVALNFKVNPLVASTIYKDLGLQYQDLIIYPIIQEAVKANTAKYVAEDLIDKRVEVKQAITEAITFKLDSKGIIVTEVSITDFNFSPEFNKAIEEKVAQEQKTMTAERKLAEMEFNAKAMRLQSELLDIKKLDIQQIMVNRWNGVMPNVVIINGGSKGGDNLMLELPEAMLTGGMATPAPAGV